MQDAVYDSTRERSPAHLARDLIRSRELLFDLVRKDFRVRYRYAALGFLWAVLEPLALTAVLTFVFSYVFAGKLAFVSGGAERPFAVALLCGLVFWSFLAQGAVAGAQSLIDNQNLVKKMRFTREIIPLAALGYPLVHAGIGAVLLLLAHVVFGGALGLALLWLPVIFAIQAAMVAGLALLLACGNALYRDIGYVTHVALMFGFYATPVFYPLEFVQEAEALPEWIRTAYLLNPMAELITAYRQVLFELRFPDLRLLAWPAAAGAGLLLLGAVTFRRLAPTLSDHL